MLPCGKTVDRGGEVSDIDQISVQGKVLEKHIRGYGVEGEEI